MLCCAVCVRVQSFTLSHFHPILPWYIPLLSHKIEGLSNEKGKRTNVDVAPTHALTLDLTLTQLPSNPRASGHFAVKKEIKANPRDINDAASASAPSVTVAQLWLLGREETG